MSERERKIDEMQALVNKYQGIQPDQPVQEPTESIWDTIKRTKSNLIDKPLENLRIMQKTQALKAKKYTDEMQDILRQ